MFDSIVYQLSKRSRPWPADFLATSSSATSPSFACSGATKRRRDDRPSHDAFARQHRSTESTRCRNQAPSRILRDNPAGVLVIRDELSGWLATLDKPGREGERGFFLSAWNGDTGYTLDRIGRGSIHVPACCVSMIGGIQPARLRSYLAGTLQDGPLNDGLFQRFQLLIYPDPLGDWRYVDRPPNAGAVRHAEQIYSKLANVDVAHPLTFRHSADAQELLSRG